MPFKFKLQLIVLPIIVVPILIVSFIFILNSTRSISTLQNDIMDYKINTLKESCITAHDLLVKSQTDGIFLFVEQKKRSMINLSKEINIPGGYIFIIDGAGKIVYHPEQNKIKKLSDEYDFINKISALKTGNTRYNTDLKGDSVEPMLARFVYFDKWDWVLIATASEKIVYAEINSSRNLAILAMLISSILALIILYLAARTISKPIERLDRASVKVSEGDYDVSVEVEGKDEISKLSQTFNNMITRIKEFTENLEDLVKQRTEELNIANSELQRTNDIMKKDLMMARKVQQAIIPKVFPVSDRIKIEGMIYPMDDLGGDLYDVYKISDTKTGIVVLDVCGHGVPAALITTMAKVSFMVNSRDGVSSGKIVKMVNKEIHNIISEIGSYFTAFYCIIDTEKETMEYTNAGHNEIYIVKESGELVQLKADSVYVGVLDDFDYPSTTISLDCKDRLVFYTDGIIETMNESRELFGAERFEKILKDGMSKSSKELVDRIFYEVKEFRGDHPATDDLTLLIADINLSGLSDQIKIDFEAATEKAKTTLSEVGDSLYKSMNEVFLNAVKAHNFGNFEESIGFLLEVNNKFNRLIENFNVLNLLGHNYFKLHDYANAMRFWEEALALNPDSKSLQHNISITRNKLDK